MQRAMCDPEEFVTHTISYWNGDTIKISQGENPESNPWFTWQDPEPMTHWPIRYMAVKSHGSDAYW